MKKVLFLMLTLIVMSAAGVNAQVRIGGDVNPHTSAILDLNATDAANAGNLGLALPRVTLNSTTDATTIVSPAAGLVVYNTATAGDVTPGTYYHDGANWVRIGGGSLTDNQGINELTGDVTAPLTANGSAAATIAANAITSAKIADGAIAAADIANGAVTLDKVAANAVNSAKIVDGSVTSADIADATIVNADIANSTIDGEKIVSSVALAGSPTTTTQATATNNTTIATTAFVKAAVAEVGDVTSIGGNGACTWYKVAARNSFSALILDNTKWITTMCVILAGYGVCAPAAASTPTYGSTCGDPNTTNCASPRIACVVTF
ncbi:MAG: hypothetical protein LBO74_10425 [Candidatus Symbiothrix sp.]|nr:hypothetical protein [Candidatus Symbiothrix sp.]